MGAKSGIPIQKSTYRTLKTLKFYDNQWELTSFKDGDYAEFREDCNRTVFNDVVRGIRLRDDIFTLVEFPFTHAPKSSKVSDGVMRKNEEESGDWAELTLIGSYYLERILQFFYNFPLRSRMPSSDSVSHRLEYNDAYNIVEDILARVMKFERRIHEYDGWCSYYLNYKDSEKPNGAYMRTHMDGSRVTLYVRNDFILSFNPCRYSEEELYRWLIACRMAMDSISEVSPSNPKDYSRISW